MGVLARELDAYQRALALYNRQAASHNQKGKTYDATLVRDAAGNVLVQNSRGNVMAVDDKGVTTGAQLPVGFDVRNYGKTPIESNASFSLLRQGGAEGVYPNKPDDWTKTFDNKEPTYTKAQLTKEGQPSLAAQEAGLIGEVLQGGGLKSGVKSYRIGSAAADAAAAEIAAKTDGTTTGGGKPGTKTNVMVA